MRARAALVCGLVLAACAAFAPARADAFNPVDVRNNFFSPQTIEIAAGETVTWIVREAGHTITADDERFSFPEGGGTLRAGQTVSWTFGSDETLTYRCLVHGPGMNGVVVVGEGSPPPPPPPEPPRRVVPSPEYPTIARALVDAEPTTVIEILPGVYHSSIVVARPDITIRGAGASLSDVVIEGDGLRAVGFDVRADGVRIENLTVRHHGVAGIDVAGVDRFVVRSVEAVANGSFGIRARAATHGAIRDSSASGSGTAGFAIVGCDPCDIDVDGVTAASNAVGVLIGEASSVLIREASSVLIRGSDVRGNGAGIVVRGEGVHIWGNIVSDNADPAAPGSDDARGAGIWLDGGRSNVVEGNTVARHRYGIVVTALAGPALQHRVTMNTVSDASLADLAWDGIGADVCFGGNHHLDGSEPSSEPPLAETIYSCDLPHTVGIPWPLVTVGLLDR